MRDRPRVLPFLLIAMAILVANAPAILSPFFLDDYVLLGRAAHLAPNTLFTGATLRGGDLQAFWWVPPVSEVRYFRPLVTVSMALDLRLWGGSAFGCHCTNLILHLLASLIVYRIARQLLRDRNVAIAASMLFALHPIHAGAVQWISGRSDVIMSIFYLGALTLYLDLRLAHVEDAAAAAPGPSVSVPSVTGASACRHWAKAVLALAFFGAALLSKESAISLPCLVLAVEPIVRLRGRGRELEPEHGRGLPARLALAGIVLLGVAYALLRAHALVAPLPPTPYRIPPGPAMAPAILLQALLYALACFCLIPVLPFHNLEAWVCRPWVLVIASMVLLSATLLGWRRTRRRAVFAFLVAWFLITLGPALPIMMGERLAYLPSVGFCLLVAMVLEDEDRSAAQETEAGESSRRRGRSIRLLVPGLLCLYGAATMAHGAILRDLAEESERVTEAIVDRGLEGPPPHCVYVCNGWIPSSLWITQAVEWWCRGANRSLGQAGGREDPPDRDSSPPSIVILTLSGDLFPPSFRGRHPVTALLIRWLARPISSDAIPQVVRVDPTSALVAARPGDPGLFDAPLLRFFLFGRGGFGDGEVVENARATAEILDGEGARVRKIRFTLPDAASAPGGTWLLQNGLDLMSVGMSAEMSVDGPVETPAVR